MPKDNFQNKPQDKPQDKQRDTLFAKPQDMIVDFEFDDSVAAVFSDMIRRSVPGYATLVTLTGLLAEQYVRPKSRVYDLGCSLGAITLSVLQRIANIDCQMLAVDNSQSMVERCQQNLPEDTGNATVEVRCADMQDVEIRQASIVVINLTLQFVDPALRSKLLANIYQGLLPGGALILSEKIVFDNAQEQQFQENMHIAFKKANAYSELEISQKRTALENVLIPDSIETHIDRLRKAGFESVHQWFQCFNFVSLIAIK